MFWERKFGFLQYPVNICAYGACTCTLAHMCECARTCPTCMHMCTNGALAPTPANMHTHACIRPTCGRVCKTLCGHICTYMQAYTHTYARVYECMRLMHTYWQEIAKSRICTHYDINPIAKLNPCTMRTSWPIFVISDSCQSKNPSLAPAPMMIEVGVNLVGLFYWLIIRLYNLSLTGLIQCQVGSLWEDFLSIAHDWRRPNFTTGDMLVH